jgi:hypothetical protein
VGGTAGPRVPVLESEVDRARDPFSGLSEKIWSAVRTLRGKRALRLLAFLVAEREEGAMGRGGRGVMVVEANVWRASSTTSERTTQVISTGTIGSGQR